MPVQMGICFVIRIRTLFKKIKRRQNLYVKKRICAKPHIYIPKWVGLRSQNPALHICCAANIYLESTKPQLVQQQQTGKGSESRQKQFGIQLVPVGVFKLGGFGLSPQFPGPY